MDVGPVSVREHGSAGEDDDDDLLVFVERLAAAGQGERATTLAREQISRAIRAGSQPPGLRRLAEALAASVADAPPAPRRPVDDPTSVVPAMQANALVVLDEGGPTVVAAAVAALVADGRRVLVTAETDAELAEVRQHVPAGRVTDALPTLPAPELRELRRLLATTTASARARVDQQLPPDEALPPASVVERLCALAAHVPTGTLVSMVPALLAGVEPERRAAVTAVARCVTAKLDALGSRREQAWEWELLGHLIHTRHRATFDRTLEDTVQAAGIVAARRNAVPVTVLGAIPSEGVELLIDYHTYLKGGGRARTYFRPTVQREVQPLLRLIRVADREPADERDILRVLDHLELGERMRRVEAGCREMRIPVPRGPEHLAGLAEGLGRVAAAARSVGALRHDVLFLATDSPLSVPDVESAAEVAAAILEFDEHGSAAESARRLDAVAAGIAALAPVAATAPEHAMAVQALRDRDAARYAQAAEAMGAARREQRDGARRAELLDRLRATAPSLAGAWESSPEHGSAAFGFACFVRTEALLASVPSPDSADVVLVVGAGRLGVERLLLAAVAPRMIATVDPADDAEASPSLLSVLQRASALVIRGQATRAPGRVVRLNSARTGAGASAVGQAG